MAVLAASRQTIGPIYLEVRLTASCLGNGIFVGNDHCQCSDGVFCVPSRCHAEAKDAARRDVEYQANLQTFLLKGLPAFFGKIIGQAEVRRDRMKLDRPFVDLHLQKPAGHVQSRTGNGVLRASLGVTVAAGIHLELVEGLDLARQGGLCRADKARKSAHFALDVEASDLGRHLFVNSTHGRATHVAIRGRIRAQKAVHVGINVGVGASTVTVPSPQPRARQERITSDSLAVGERAT